MITKETIDKALEIIRSQTNPQRAWDDFLSFCHLVKPSDLWQSLPAPEIERDVFAALQWLSSQIAALSDSRGIYLGLDTLNMDGSNGYNVEFGSTPVCDISSDKIDWIYGKLKYGDKHLIRGLFELHQVYSQPQWKTAFSFADYFVFLEYSGIILGQAFIRLLTNRSLLPAWGFHDGDLFVLGRKTLAGFDFICR